MTVEQYERMLADQGGGCAICGSPRDAKRSLAVDHDHATGAIRGILCSGCNTGLGLLRDSRELLLRAADYLQPVT